MRTSKDSLNKLVLPPLRNEGLYYSQDAGNEHYRLLARICEGRKLVYDIGTYQGFSAAAMSTAKKVISYDLEYLRVENNFPPNITFKIGDCLKDKGLKKAEVILLDTYHNGDFEQKFLNHLKVIGFKGILILDDIYFSPVMTKIWDSIELRKEDLTDIGHHSGTGVVYYE